MLMSRLGLDRDDDFAHLPQFDREMRRRVYCILQILDWYDLSLTNLEYVLTLSVGKSLRAFPKQQL